MASDFELALRDVTDTDKPLTAQLLVTFSGPSRAESDAFVARLAEVDVERRRELVAAMVGMAEKSFTLDYIALFRCLLADGDPVVRRYAVEGLWEDESASLVEPFLRLLASDPDSDVRAVVAMSLGRFVFMSECDELDARRATLVRQALERVIEDPSEKSEVVRRAIESIAYINDQRVRRIIDRAYDCVDSRMRESAVFAMGRSADPFWADTVLAELHDDSPAMRYEAARACGELQLKRAVTQLLKLAQDPDREVQGMAVWALGQIGGKRAQLALEGWAEGDDEALALVAAEALQEIGFANAPLDLMVYDPDEERDGGLILAEEKDELDDAEDESDDEDDWADEPLT